MDVVVVSIGAQQMGFGTGPINRYSIGATPTALRVSRFGAPSRRPQILRFEEIHHTRTGMEL
jgi:hypothetical protein